MPDLHCRDGHHEKQREHEESAPHANLPHRPLPRSQPAITVMRTKFRSCPTLSAQHTLHPMPMGGIAMVATHRRLDHTTSFGPGAGYTRKAVVSWDISALAATTWAWTKSR